MEENDGDSPILCEWYLSFSEEEGESDNDDSDAESIPLIASPPEVLEPCHFITRISGLQNECSGFRICGDNIDKTVKARYMRVDRKNLSLHYFHSYAVLNRIDASSLSDVVPDVRGLDLEVVANSLLPSEGDDAVMRSNMAMLVSRVLVENFEYFKFAFEDVVQRHIKHQFYEEMSSKSVLVSL